MSERLLRSIQNSKGNSVNSGSTKGTMSHAPSRANMSEGEEVYALLPNGTLYLYKKVNGLLFRSDFSYNGNNEVDNNLDVKGRTSTGTLEYKNKFIDHRIFIHNFSDNIGTDVVFLPWQGTGEQANMNNATSAFLTPYTMTCHKILFRPESLGGATSADISFTIHRQDDGDTTTDTVARFTHTPTLVSNTLLTVNESGFNNPPTVEAGAKAGISISATIDPAGGTIDYYITSVWRVEVEI